MYHHATRLLTILTLLQSVDCVGGPELAARLGVDGRTVRRNITQLQDMGIPIVAVPGRGGGYRLRPGYRLPPLMLSDGEAAALGLGLLLVARLGIDGSTLAVSGAQAKLRRVLPPRLLAQDAALAKVQLSVAAADVTVDSETLLTLALAAHAGQRVQLTYTGEQRNIDPHALLYNAGRWYCVAHCHARGAQRIFRLDRIESVEVLAERFTPPSAFDAHAALTARIAAIPDVHNYLVWLGLPLDVAQRRVPGGLGTLAAHGEGCTLVGSINDLDWLARTLTGLGCAISVLEPAALRAAFAQLARELWAVAEQESLQS